MKGHFLRLNPDKTKIIIFGPERVLEKINIHGAVLDCGTVVRFSEEVKNLGVVFDNKLTFKSQVASVTRKCLYNIRCIYKMKSFLSRDQKKILVCSMVMSALDYSNSVYCGMNSVLFNRLQVVQNTAARLIFNCRKRQSASELCHNLHWLPSRERVLFKIILYVWKCLNGLAPSYLSELIIPTLDPRRPFDLYVPRSLSSFGDRAFCIAGPKAWNVIPLEIRSITEPNKFKSKLKHYLFNMSDSFHNMLNLV